MTKQTYYDKQIEEMLDGLAKKHFVNIETFETRKRDCLDFHDVPVWAIRKAMKAAFELERKM